MIGREPLQRISRQGSANEVCAGSSAYGVARFNPSLPKTPRICRRVDQLCVLCRVSTVGSGRVAVFGDHIAVGIRDQGSTLGGSTLPGFIGRREGPPK